jgi:hypothetical protein
MWGGSGETAVMAREKIHLREYSQISAAEKLKRHFDESAKMIWDED